MDGKQVLDALELDQQLIFNHQVESVAAVKALALVLHRQWNLACHSEMGLSQLANQAGPVHGLQKTRTQGPVNFDR